MTTAQTTLLAQLLAAGCKIEDALNHVQNANGSTPDAHAVTAPFIETVRKAKSAKPIKSKTPSATTTPAVPPSPKVYTVKVERCSVTDRETGAPIPCLKLSGLGKALVKSVPFFERLAAFDPSSKLSTLIVSALKS